MNLPIHGVLAARNLKVCTETHLYWGPRSNKQACVVAQPPWTFSDESRLTRLCTNIKSQRYDPSPSAASMPTSTRRTFPTINISITHHCSSCDFDEGEDNNKGLLQGALQMMNPSTSFRTAFDDFTPGKECKQWKEKNWSCYREISISHRTEQVYAMTSEDRFITVVLHKQIQHQNMCANMRMIWRPSFFDLVRKEMTCVRQTTEPEHEELEHVMWF